MLKYTKIRDVKCPERWHSNDSGIDFFIPEEAWLIQILPWQNIKIPLWIKILMPIWYDFTFVNKSGIASKTWLITWACLVDNWYRWELVLNLINTTKYEAVVKWWTKIVQGVIRKCEYLMPEEIDNDEWYCETNTEGEEERGEGAFGSTWT